MKNFTRFAFITTAATYFLIFVGGLVRVSGAGLGCPDWPRCFGRWIPPTSVEQLPPAMDPAQFNFVLAWIEYINRLIGVFVGLLILVTALWALKAFRRHISIVVPASLAAVLTAVQGWLGSVVVSSLLEPIIVTAHMVLALIIVSLLIFVWKEAYYEQNSNAVRSAVWSRNVTGMLAVLWVLAVVQIVLGTQVRSAVETLAEMYPLLNHTEWLARVGVLNHVHTAVGLLLAGLTWAVAFSLNSHWSRLNSLMRQTTVILVAIVSAQIVLGLLFIVLSLTPLVQVLHMWLASLFVGVTLMMYIISRKGQLE